MKRLALAILLVASAAACKERTPAPAKDEHAADGQPAGSPAPTEPHREDVPQTVHIEAEMLRDLRLTTAGVESRPGGEAVAAQADIQVNEDRYAEVGMPVAARIRRVLASPGDRVRRGSALAELLSQDVGQARGERREAQARVEVARKALERKRRLAEERIVPRREVEEAEANLRAAEADAQAAAASISALGGGGGAGPAVVLRSPIDGVVIDRAAVTGQIAAADAPLFKVADLRRLWLVAHVYERDAVRVRAGATGRVIAAALPGMTFTGSITMVGSRVEPNSRTIPVRVELDNREGVLRPGMAATAWLPVTEGAPVLAVPAVSLQRIEERWCVFVPRGEDTFEIRPVGRGRDLGGEVEVLSGLSAGETVVAEGAFLLKAEAEKARGEGGHHDH